MSLFLCNILYLYGVLNTSWRSYKLLNSRGKEVEERMAQIEGKSVEVVKYDVEKEMNEVLQFWAVFALLLLYDTYVEFLISFWMPFYSGGKFFFMLWLVRPELKGSTVMFQQFVKPKFSRHEGYIDNVLLPTIAAGFRYAAIGLDKFLFSTVTVNLLTDEEVNELCLEYERRLNDLRNEQVQRQDNSFLQISRRMGMNRNTSPKTSPDQSLAEGQSDSRNNDTESYFRWAYKQISPKIASKNVSSAVDSRQTEESKGFESYQETQEEVAPLLNSSQSSWVAATVSGFLELAIDTHKKLFVKAQENIGEVQPMEQDIQNVNNSKDGSNTKKGSEGVLAAKYDTGFETLLDEFDESLSDDTNHSDVSNTNNKDYLDYYVNHQDGRKDRLDSEETIDEANTYVSDESEEQELEVVLDDKNNEEKSERNKNLRNRRKQVERMSLHKPKKGTETINARRERVITRSQTRKNS